MKWCLLVIYALLLVGCGGGDSVTSPPTSTLSMDPAAWTFRYSPGVLEHPTLANGGGWQFDFPAQDGVHYLTTPLTVNLLIRQAIKVTTQIIGSDPVFMWHPDSCFGSPAKARIMVERQGDDLRSSSGRWWADIPITLEVGEMTVIAPIKPEHWSNVNGVFGTEDLVGFTDAMEHSGFIGLTYGGGCFFGHGAWLSSGTARMIIKSFSLT